MNVISFLLENIYWVIVIGGVLFSMFGRNRSKGRTNRMPSFGGGSEQRNPSQQNNSEWEEDSGRQGPYPAHRPMRPEPAARPVTAEPPARPLTVQEEGVGSGEGAMSPALERAIQTASTRPQEPPRARLSALKPAAAVISSTESKAQSLTSNAEDMRKAVVWAEVLGPPRAKRPFGK